MIKHLQKLSAVVVASCALLGSGEALGQAPITNLPYEQNFNGIGTTFPTGWTAVRYAGSGTANETLSLSESSGNSTSGAVYSAGASGSAERAIATLASGSTAPRFGASFINNTGSSIPSITISAAMEQWRSGSSNTADEVVNFEYSLNANSINDQAATWNALPALDLVELLKTSTSAGEVDGNANKANISAGLTGINWAAGATLWIRWSDTNDGGSDGMYAVDDFSITAGSSAPADEAAPVIVSKSPESGSTNILVSSPLVLTFDENVTAVAGKLITIGVPTKGTSYTVAADDASKVTINGASVSVNAGLEAGQTYNVAVEAGAFTDAAGNAITALDAADWSFSTQEPSAPSTNPLVESFDNCAPDKSTILSGGWMQYSVTGAETWACTQYGNNDTHGVQMSGYNSEAKAAQTNEDWLISPALDLTDLALPFLSVDYRTKFSGEGLQVKVSTNYSGSGDPSAATWANLVTLPADNADAWKQLKNLNLSDYKSSNTYIAFVYASGNGEAPRWTLDNFKVENTSNVLLVSNLNVNFGNVTAGSTSEAQTFTFSALGYADNIVLTAPAGFELSKDNSTFGQSLTYTPAEAASENTAYIRFAPATSDNFSGAIMFTSGTVLNEAKGMLQGSSVVYTNTLDVVTWNLEWFGSTSNGPSNEQLQYDNAKKVIQSLDPEIIALQELVDLNKVRQLAQELGYNFEDMNSGGSQQTAFLYKPEMVKVKREKLLLSKLYADVKAGTATLPGYPANSSTFWASGRLPYMVEFEVSIGGVKQSINVINIHAKANSGDDITQYERRKYDVQVLKDSLDAQYANANLIILGDFNDDVDESVVPGAPGSSYKMYVDDEDYKVLTYDLSVAGAFTYASSAFESFLDHIVISNELVDEYIVNSISVRDEVLTSIPNFRSTTSDHVPVMARFNFSGTPLVSFTDASVTKAEDAVKFNVNLTLSAAQTTAQTVVIKVQDNATATADDYTTAPAAANDGTITITIPAGATSAAFEVQLVDDTQKEESEQVQFLISTTSADLAVGGQNIFTLTIEDNDETPTGIADATKGQFSVYPNPVQDFVRLSLPERVVKLQNVSMVVYSIDGRSLFNANGSLQSVQQVLNSQVTGLKQGLYILKINAGKEVFVSRMLKK